jgi:hypothetical protein
VASRSIVEGFEVIKCGQGAVTTGGRRHFFDSGLCFEAAPERFHGGIIETVSFGAHAPFEPGGVQGVDVVLLATAIREICRIIPLKIISCSG